MRINLCEGVALVASEKTCGRVLEALQLIEDARNCDPFLFEDWYDYNSEIEYCYGRADLLLGLIEPTLEAIECFGRI